MEIDAIFLCCSTIKPKIRQAWTYDERFNQVIDSNKTIKKYLPNSITVLLEGSELTNNERQILEKEYDYVIYCYNDIYLKPFIDNTYNIGYGENALLLKGIEYINLFLLSKYKPKYIFKLSARYYLNNKFNFENYDKDKFTFKKHMEEKDAYIGALFGIPLKHIDKFQDILLDSLIKQDLIMIEKMYYKIDKKIVYTIETLGFEGGLSYNKTYVEA